MLLLSCGVAFAHDLPFVLLGLSLGAWDSFDRRGLYEKRKVVNSSLQMRVVVSVNPRRISLLGREAVTVGAAGSVAMSLWRDASMCVCVVCGSLGPSRLQREDGVWRGPGLLVLLMVLLSRDPDP